MAKPSPKPSPKPFKAVKLKPMTPSMDLVRPSVDLLVKYIEPVLYLFVLPSLVLALGAILIGDTSHWHHAADINHRQRLGLGVLALGIVWSVINFAPSLYFRLQAAAGQQRSLGQIYRQGWHFFWRLAGLYLFFAVAIIIGFALFIFPGFVIAALIIHRYYLANYYLVDQDLSIKEALLKAHAESQPYVGYVWGVVFVQFGFAVLAAVLSSFLGPIGKIVALFISFICLFLPALRYYEIAR